MPVAFLMQQMSWREALDDARADSDLPALEQLDAELRTTQREQLAQIAVLLDQTNYAEAGQVVRQLMFLEKFSEDVARVFETLEV